MINYDPKEMLKKAAPESKLKKLLSKRLTLKKAALSFISDIPFINKKAIETVALKTIKEYKKRAEDDKDDARLIKKDPKLLVQRVQNAVVYQVSQEIRHQYNGEYYIWLPSDASEPDPQHQLRYGKRYQIGDGEMPGERFGCRCGMQILVDETELALD